MYTPCKEHVRPQQNKEVMRIQKRYKLGRERAELTIRGLPTGASRLKRTESEQGETLPRRKQREVQPALMGEARRQGNRQCGEVHEYIMILRTTHGPAGLPDGTFVTADPNVERGAAFHSPEHE